MTGKSGEYRPEGFEDSDDPLPRDMPDQQAGGGEDPWSPEPAADTDGTDSGNDGSAEGESETGAPDVPDVDEGGAGPRSHPPADSEHPEPEEPSG